MKLITLNTWGGRVEKPLLDFVNDHQAIDVFCFQELLKDEKETMKEFYPGISSNLFPKMCELLPDHMAFFRPSIENVDAYGIGAFVKNTIEILEEGDMIIYSNTEHPPLSGHHTRNLQWLKIKIAEKSYTIVNVHGLWNGQGKTDTEDRLAQSKRIKDFVNTIEGPTIVCGDFNLRPDTESLRIVAEGMRDLIKEHNVETTRTSHYAKPEKFADYIFTSEDIQVNHFEVLPDEVSDHAALLLDFE